MLERSSLDFLAVGNLNRRNPQTGDPEHMSGLGQSTEEAVNDFLTRFVSDIREHAIGTELTSGDFEWSSPEDF